MSRKGELKQEAAAWRECAEWVLGGEYHQREFLCHVLHPRGMYQGPCLLDTPPAHWPLPEMHERVSDHAVIGDYGTLDEEEWPQSNFVRAVFCDLMALECLDEAKEVTRRKH